MNNPLLQPFTHLKGPHGAIQFDQVKNEHFLPAFEQALSEARENLKKIKTQTMTPDFENTIVALETSSENLDFVAGLFSNYLHAHTNDTLQALAKEVMPKLAEFSNDVSLDPELFARVKAVHDLNDLNESNGSKPKLDREQQQLLTETYRDFVRNGALLSDAQKTRLREIDSELSVQETEYGERVLKGTQAFELLLTDKADLAGLPASVVDGAASLAKERGKTSGWLITLDYPSLVPFLKFSEKRDLREKVWRAAQGVSASDGAFDNRTVAIRITTLRTQRAKLLGYKNHAHFVLEERMATNPETVKAFLTKLNEPSKKAAERDLEELRKFSGQSDLQPWDFAFHSEKLKQKKFSFNEEELKPHFKLENVIQGVFEHAKRLYDLQFTARKDLPTYHPDVQVFEVNDLKTGDYIGLFYADFFPRPSKQNGAWMTSFKDQGLLGGQIHRPHVSIVCNLTKPTETAPSLLGLQEVKTIFHEFGHALHLLLSQCKYRSLAGPNVYWDFVELPSQIMENWVNEQESLHFFANHYQTGEVLSAEWVKKIQESEKFQAGYQSLRQISFAMLDMAWHGVGEEELPKQGSEVEAYETNAVKNFVLFKHVEGTMMSSHFTHIFSGGYSAGYYSYKWAEVLAADAFEFFKEKGVFNREVADRFRSHVLSRGGTEHPMELYKRFRGREPDPNALLRQDGLI
ncbi:MAG: M3 family metallopeptidase [Methylotenera sp.]|nr:M3 family metallopeptidase [Oligoflexia bacterium]